VIAHSLGSIVAYEAVQTLAHPLPLLITLGAPLGSDPIILHRLQPHASFPPQVNRWVNIADPDDIIAAEPDLKSLFSTGKPASSWLERHSTDGGSDPNNARFYLSKAAVGHAVASALTETSLGEGSSSDRTEATRVQSSQCPAG
jgi:hypothetical protein